MTTTTTHATSSSVVRPDGRTFDVNRLAREVREDVELFRRHGAEDGMKKRAVLMSKDYDEFRSFVSVSELKPTTGREVSSLFCGAAGSSVKGRTAVIDSGSAGGGVDRGIQRRKDEAVGVVASAAITKTEARKEEDVHFRAPDGNTRGVRLKARKNETSCFDIDSLLNGGDVYSSAMGKERRKRGEKERGSTVRNRKIVPPKQKRPSRDAFLREWERHCRSAETTLNFLAREESSSGDGNGGTRTLVLEPEETCKQFFRTEIDATPLGDVVGALRLLLIATGTEAGIGACNDGGDSGPIVVLPHRFRNCGECSDVRGVAVAFATEWLRALPRCGRFGLAASFLTSDQRCEAKEVCDLVEGCVRKNDAVATDEEGGDVKKVVTRFRNAL